MYSTERSFEPNPQLVDQYLCAYMALDRFEKGSKGGSDVIDFDLIPDDLNCPASSFNNREEFIAHFKRLADQVSQESMVGEYMRSKLIATAASLQALEMQQQGFFSLNFLKLLRRTGQLSLEEYVQPILGILPNPIHSYELDGQRNRVQGRFHEITRQQFGVSAWGEFLETSQLGPHQFLDALVSAEERLLPIVFGAIGKSFDRDFKTEGVFEDAGWVAWMSGSRREGFLQRVNLHPRNSMRMVKGAEEVLAIHEAGGHWAQAKSWMENIDSSLISRGYAITSIPGPEQWNCEGMASTLVWLIPELYDEISDHGRFIAELQYYTYMVYNNAHIRINNPGVHKDDVVEEVQARLPSESPDRISFMLDQMRRNPKNRVYQLAYSDGSYYHRGIAAEFQGLPQKRAELVRAYYRQPLTPEQDKTRVNQLRAVVPGLEQRSITGPGNPTVMFRFIR